MIHKNKLEDGRVFVLVSKRWIRAITAAISLLLLSVLFLSYNLYSSTERRKKAANERRAYGILAMKRGKVMSETWYQIQDLRVKNGLQAMPLPDIDFDYRVVTTGEDGQDVYLDDLYK